jgi:carboxylesterase
MDAQVAVPDAGPWSSPGHGTRSAVGVVVVHGFTANPRGTRSLGERLASAGFAVDVPLLPGHGTSVRDLARTRYSDWRARVERSVADLAADRDRIVVVGHSIGGTIALDLAATSQVPLAAAVTINAMVLDRAGLLARIAPVLQHVLPYVPRGAAGMPTDDFMRPGVQEGAYAWVSARAAQSLLMQLPRVRRGLAAVTCPVLVVTSPQDRTVDPANGPAIVAALAPDRVETLVCARSRHVPQLDHDEELVGERVVAFVAAATAS